MKLKKFNARAQGRKEKSGAIVAMAIPSVDRVLENSQTPDVIVFFAATLCLSGQ
ncbi:hypothetical protein JXO59_14325 [candidate division KSB1 bacterium]|nr:hypothetical protein [candidate division KSB1 bacterium]